MINCIVQTVQYLELLAAFCAFFFDCTAILHVLPSLIEHASQILLWEREEEQGKVGSSSRGERMSEWSVMRRTMLA